jgi:soluble lytic murein transglycosylase-like protein
MHVQGQGNDQSLRKRARLYEPIIAAAAARYNVDAHLLWTIAYLESRFRPEAVSYKGGKPCAYGLMQFVPATAQRYRLKNPHDPEEAVDAAARYVRDLLKRFGGRGDLVLAAYNAGEGTVEAFRDGKRLVLPNRKVINPAAIRTGGIPPYVETREYVARGRFIYQNIADGGLFSASSKLLAPAAFEAAALGRDSEEKEAEASIYILDMTSRAILRKERSQSPKFKKAAQAQSLYAY